MTTDKHRSLDSSASGRLPRDDIIDSFWRKLVLTLRMIKIQHSVFALPFALSSVFVATLGRPRLFPLILIILAMVTARNSAMSFNRIVDRDFDKVNPRTQNREIPSGKLSLKFSILFCTTNAILFVFISLFFNELAFILSPVALIIILGYSFTKRFTHYTQLFIGLALGIAPIAAWIALTGELATFPILLGLAVLCWVAGFDIIYTTLDHDFDKDHGLKNMVVQWGIKKSLIISKILHVLSIVFLILAGLSGNMGVIYFAGCLLCGALLAYEQSLVKPSDLSKVNMAFFTLNGYVSLLFFAFALFDIYL